MIENTNTENKDLTNEDAAYSAILGGEFGALEINTYIGSKTSEGIYGGDNNENDDEEEGEIAHLPDAIDFEDEDELASESEQQQNNEQTEEDAQTTVSMAEQERHELRNGNTDYIQLEIDTGTSNNNNLFEMNEEIFTLHEVAHTSDVEREEAVTSTKLITNKGMESPTMLTSTKQNEFQKLADEEKQLLKAYFPTFKKGKLLKLTKLLPPKPQEYNWHNPTRPLKPLLPTTFNFDFCADTKDFFNSGSTFSGVKNTNIVTVNLNELFLIGNNGTGQMNAKDEESGKNLDTNRGLEEEESDAVKEDGELKKSPLASQLLSKVNALELECATDNWDTELIISGENARGRGEYESIKSDVEIIEEDWNWNEEQLINGDLGKVEKPVLDINDERLLIKPKRATADDNEESDEEIKRQKKRKAFNYLLNRAPETLLTKFNLSNDKSYDILKQNYQAKIRSNLSNLNIEHSLPALKLQSPFYKVLMTKEQLRFFHKYQFGAKIRPGTTILFSKLKTRKRKRDRGKDVRESFQRSSDLTIGDTAPVFLLEYSEQSPVGLSKFGMGSKLINYYRKMSENDTSRPKLPVGETHVLGVQDKSPFWNFGFVEPGNIVPTLYNNMIRAPVFKHDALATDFLLVKSTGSGNGTRFYLRLINNLFTVGQTYPCLEIPGPNSRKVTAMGKNRLRMVVYRLLNKSPRHRLLVRQVSKHFPEQSEMQNRQRLKEFMKYQRDGEDHGFWKLKEGETLPDVENIRKMITPEDCSLIENMMQGQQFLDDDIFVNLDEQQLKLEESLSPWNVTKNFLNATQMRAMLAIHGEGDPTGCGEGFSLLKTSMKGGFSRNDSGGTTNNHHTYNVAQQQKNYEEEIAKTWYIQARALSVNNPYEEINNPYSSNESNRKVVKRRKDGKVLKIVRKKRDENKIIQRETLFVRDPRVINGYLQAYKRKNEIKEANLNLDILMSDDISKVVSGKTEEEITLKQKKLLEEQLMKLQKSQERRNQRKLAKELTATADGTMDSSISATASIFNNEENKNETVLTVNGKPLKNTNRKCANCGAIGHIKTNRSCPMYSQMQ
ncbi:histone acetyltransferase SCDLUD_004848 [Saccharomycodes ludwigii]|uniref:histone acetyltransferase n=1 Tax=Saccharomycodes ludwigii TaxID=36035 RepID=UPI001E83DF5A|nr:hypothetical protein SCDLUD_004848 [Saccharomycodes ludwigii]KAH3899405.1 hypothetical protein SCDLUD_004848 [Saccharomycodes ludwigii]